MSTYSARPADVEHKWFVVDADGMVLGRLATEVAKIIRGKHKPVFTPNADCGDFVVVINADKVKVTEDVSDGERKWITKRVVANAQAIAIPATRPTYDAVLLDFRLPDSSDLGLLARLRQLLPGTPVVLMTAFSTPDVIEEARQLGVFTVLDKPFELDALKRIANGPEA